MPRDIGQIAHHEDRLIDTSRLGHGGQFELELGNACFGTHDGLSLPCEGCQDARSRGQQPKIDYGFAFAPDSGLPYTFCGSKTRSPTMASPSGVTWRKKQ